MKRFNLLLIGLACVGQANAYKDLTVSYFNVGPGNCVLVNCPGAQDINLLIDCGSHRINEKGDVIQRLFEKSQGNLTHVVLSHPDRDHYNWIDDLFYLRELPGGGYLPMGTVYTGGKFSDYKEDGVNQVLQLMASGSIYGSEIYSSTANPVIAAYSRVGKRPRDGSTAPTYNYKRVDRLVVSGMTTPPPNLNICGDADVRLLAGNSGDANSWGVKTNPQSLVLSLSWAGRHFIFPGDATNTATDLALEKALNRWALVRNQGLPIFFDSFYSGMKVDFLMIPHHGSSTEGSNWDGWAKVTRPDHIIFSGDPSSSTPSLRHPKEEGYLPYRGRLVKTTEHELQVAHDNPNIFEELESKRHFAETRQLTIQEAALPLHDMSHTIVTVTPPEGSQTEGEVWVECGDDWCGTNFFETEPHPAAYGLVSTTHPNTKIEAPDNTGVVGGDSGSLLLTLVGKGGNPLPNVSVRFVAINNSRPRLMPESGKTDDNGRFSSTVTESGSGSATEYFEAYYDSNGDDIPDTKITNGSPASIFFTISVGG